MSVSLPNTSRLAIASDTIMITIIGTHEDVAVACCKEQQWYDFILAATSITKDCMLRPITLRVKESRDLH
jgi:hypothetical protein